MKTAIKIATKKTQNGLCAISGGVLPLPVPLYDANRKIPKSRGGRLSFPNVQAVLPRPRMKKQGTLREREELFEILKGQMDSRRHVMQLRNKINNQLLAMERGTDFLDADTKEFLNSHLDAIAGKLVTIDTAVSKTVKEMVKTDPLVKAAIGVKSIGPMTVANCLIYIDLEKARHASSLWAYAGLDKPSHSRYEKGTAGGGNKTLRTALYTMADSQIKGRGPYRAVYDAVKHRLSCSDKLVMSRNTQGKLVEVAWKDAKPCHRHGAGIRAIMKHFLADYWFVGRMLRGLPTDALYVEAMLGENHRVIRPEERGWVYLR